MTHTGDTKKVHIVERKLGQMESNVRSWYFCRFEN